MPVNSKIGTQVMWIAILTWNSLSVGFFFQKGTLGLVWGECWAHTGLLW